MKKFALFATLLTLLPSLSFAQGPSAEDRFAMMDAITSIAAGADRHDWHRVRGAFADQVTLDYSSLWGGEAVTQPADEVINQWSGFLPGFDVTHHLVSNYTIQEFTGETAIVDADFQATHRIEDNYWTLLGRYTYGLVKSDKGWQVNKMVMEWTHEHGDRGLVGVAADRMQQTQ